MCEERKEIERPESIMQIDVSSYLDHEALHSYNISPGMNENDYPTSHPGKTPHGEPIELQKFQKGFLGVFMF